LDEKLGAVYIGRSSINPGYPINCFGIKRGKGSGSGGSRRARKIDFSHQEEEKGSKYEVDNVPVHYKATRRFSHGVL